MKDKLKKVKKPAKLLKTKKKKLGEPGKKTKMQTMSVDDFMSGFMGEEGRSIGDGKDKKKSKKKNIKSKDLKGKINSKVEGKEDLEDEEVDDDDDGDDDGLEDEFSSHKKQLDGLKKSDPEFYKYLEENDQELLNFDDSEGDSEDDEKNEKFHKAPDSLEVASDESDYEPDEEIRSKRKGVSNLVTTEMVTNWRSKLSKGSIEALREVTDAFRAAVVSVSPEEDATSTYKVEGATAFNSVIRLCVVDFLPGVLKALKMEAGFKAHPKSSRNWTKVKPILKSYLTNLSELSGVSSPNMLTVLLKHIHQLSPFIACFPGVAPRFLKRVIQLWAMDEDVVRVLAFLCALRLANLRPSLLRQALKTMHLTYVRNTKFVSPSTLPGINFMRQSLCEMFALDDTISYSMAFIYIRQLAIHLRNAITLKKKDSYRTVYNWAYVSSLHLWANLFGMVPASSPLRSLAYPLVQIIIGTIKLIPSAQFFPLRFHCVRILINMGDKCGIFIPILPFLLEVLRDFNFNREHKKLSMKPMDLTCLLRCSKSQMKENGFKDALIENVHDLLMEYLVTECHRLSFPDITVPCVLEMKHFLKTCTVANYNKKIKAILDKLTENSKFVEGERKKLSLKLEDLKGVEAAEAGIRAKEPPFLKYYDSWKKIHLQHQARKITNNQKLGDFKLPVLNKLQKKRNQAEESDGPPELFPSDDDEDDDGEDILKHEDEDDDDEEEEEPPKKRAKQRQEKKKKNAPDTPKPAPRATSEVDEEEEEEDGEDGGDIVEDLDYSDFV